MRCDVDATVVVCCGVRCTLRFLEGSYSAPSAQERDKIVPCVHACGHRKKAKKARLP